MIQDLNLLRVFYYVAKTEQISKAAEILNVSQPAITHNIRKLEGELGGKLFYKTNKGIELTEEGKNLYRYIENSIEILNNAEEKFRQSANMENGVIRIRTGRTIAQAVLYEPLKIFMKRYPNIKIEMTHGGHSESIKLLNNGELDIVMVNMTNEIEMQNIDVVSLVEKEYVFVMSKKYKEKNNVVIKDVNDLNNYDLIASTKGTTYRKVLENNILEGKKLNIKYEIMMEKFKKELVLDDFGIAFMMKDEIKEELEQGLVEIIDVIPKKIKSELGIALLKKEIRSFAAQKLFEIIQEYLKWEGSK